MRCAKSSSSVSWHLMTFGRALSEGSPPIILDISKNVSAYGRLCPHDIVLLIKSTFFQWQCCFSNHNVYTSLSVTKRRCLKFIIGPNQKPTEAQRYHCQYNFTTAIFILLPRDLFYCREFYFHHRKIIILPQDFFYCREFHFTATRFIWRSRVLFSPPRVLFYHREICLIAASFILPQP